MKNRFHRRQYLAATMAGATALSVVVATHGASASAEVAMAEAIAVQNDSDNAGIRAQGQTQGQLGGQYRITGQKWCFGDKKTGQWVGVKLLDGEDANSGIPVNMDAAHANIPQPDGSEKTKPNNLGKRGVIAMLKASDDPTGAGNCSLDATVTLPDASNSDATVDRFPQSAKRSLVLLAGSFGPGATSGGTAPHGATLGMTVGEPVQDTPPAPTTSTPAPTTSSTAPSSTEPTSTAPSSTAPSSTAPTTTTASPIAARTVSMTGQRVQGVIGQYEGAYSAKTGKFYVTGAVMPSKKGDVTTNSAATIAEFDPATGQVTRAANLPTEAIPAGFRGVDDPTGLHTQVVPYGIAVDDARGLIWTTDTRQDTVSAYDLATFAPVWRSAPGEIPHGRDIYVQPNGDVVVSGGGGLWKVHGDRGTFTSAPFYALAGKGEAATPMGLAAVPGGFVINDLTTSNLTFLDANGALVKTMPLTGGSAAGIRHGGLAVDPGLGVIVEADQGKRDSATNAQTGAGVSFYGVDGTPLGYVAAGTQNLSVAVDSAQHIAYVADFATGDVNAFDLAAAKAGAPVLMGKVAAVNAGARGINNLALGGGHVLAVGKDGSYPGVTVPYGDDIRTGALTAYTGNADSLVLLTSAVTAKAYDPAKDATTPSAAPGRDLAGLPLVPAPAVTTTPTTTPVVPTSSSTPSSTSSTAVPTTTTTPTSVPTSSSTVPTSSSATSSTAPSSTPTSSTPSPSSPATSVPASGGSLDSLFGSGSLEGTPGQPGLNPLLAGLLGIGGFVSGVLIGIFTPLLAMLGIH